MDEENRPNLEEARLMQEAGRLAELTRTRGFGLLRGKFPAGIAGRLWGSAFDTMGFIQGEEVEPEAYSPRVNEGFAGITIGVIDPQGRDRETFKYMQDNPDLLTWAISFYDPPVTRIKRTERSGLFGRRQIIEERVKTYKGRHGEKGWVQYEFWQPADPAYDPDRRPGVFITMYVAVPSEVAREIDRQVYDDPRCFPQLYFQALYPGLIGPDVQNQVRLCQARRIELIDFRRTPRVRNMVRL